MKAIKTKKQWKTPQVVDLDLKDTKTGVNPNTYESNGGCPASSFHPTS